MKKITLATASSSLAIFALAAGLSPIGIGVGGADPLADFDPAEVEYLRQDAAHNRVELADGALLGSLQFGRDCRVFFDAIDVAEAGRDFFTKDVVILVERAREEGNQELAGRYQSILDDARAGDLSSAKAWAQGVGGCHDVPEDSFEDETDLGTT